MPKIHSAIFDRTRLVTGTGVHWAIAHSTQCIRVACRAVKKNKNFTSTHHRIAVNLPQVLQQCNFHKFFSFRDMPTWHQTYVHLTPHIFAHLMPDTCPTDGHGQMVKRKNAMTTAEIRIWWYSEAVSLFMSFHYKCIIPKSCFCLSSDKWTSTSILVILGWKCMLAASRADLWWVTLNMRRAPH